MDIREIIDASRIVCGTDVASKKRVLELLSQMIAASRPELAQSDVFESFIARERLGSTGLGHGVAIPHGRSRNVHETIGAFVQLEAAVDYDALDREPVDLLFALLVPEEATQEHLELLATLAELFSDEDYRRKLRAARSPDEVQHLLAGANGGTSQAASHR